jgi:hypothetical protein
MNEVNAQFAISFLCWGRAELSDSFEKQRLYVNVDHLSRKLFPKAKNQPRFVAHPISSISE